MTTPPTESTHLFEARDLRGAMLGPLSLAMDAGECVTLAGPSGAGKSQLLRALADLDPREGSVCLQGVVRERMPPTQWRRQVGYLPADSAWWADTVGEHLPEGGDAWLQRLGFDAGVREWSVERLSSGERARLALVRLLMNTPRVLLLD
ncbi:MAG: ATP-binding cassette domain-containing protein, partial [Chromatiales bacterium]|nr:ATP-binding cassette domain-containing protein [Chromatiales bacterium]